MKRSLFVALCLVLGFTAAAVAQPKQPAKGPQLPEGTKVEKNIAYGSHERNRLDVYVPPGNGPFPLLIWVHGGAWYAGSKDGNVFGMPMLAKGYAVASINYRYSTQALFPAQIEDCKAAVRFLRANAKKYKFDADRFGAAGASAGGHLVAMLGTTGDVQEFEGSGDHKDVSSRIQAVCDIFGPADLARMADAGPFPKDRHPVRLLVGGTVSEKREAHDKASPIKYVTKDDAPIIILHGTNDALVPVEQSELFHEALKKGGVESTLIIVKDAGHDGKVFTADAMKQIDAFFDKHLKKP